FFSSRRRHTRSKRDWSSDVCSSDLTGNTCIMNSTCKLFFSDPAVTTYKDRRFCPSCLSCNMLCFRNDETFSEYIFKAHLFFIHVVWCFPVIVHQGSFCFETF